MAKRKNPAAVALGRRGGKARLKTLTPDQRSEVAKKAATARWAKAKEKSGRMAGANALETMTPEQRTARAKKAAAASAKVRAKKARPQPTRKGE